MIVAVVSGAFLFKDDVIEVKETPIQVSFVTEEAVEQEDIKKLKPVEETPPPIDDKPQPAPKALEQPKPKPEKPAEETKEEKVERVTPKPAPQKPKEKLKPKPEPEKEKPKKAEEDEDTQIDFTSVLKNLQDTMPVDTDRDGPKLTNTPVSQAMTAGEVNAMIRQIQGCWNILPGAAKAETLAVVVKIMMNPDRTVRAVSIADTARSHSDPCFRAAADNAIRAIKHPDCTPLDLPPNKYDTWKEIEFNFDPGRIF